MTPWTKEHYTSLPDFTRAQLRLKRETNGSPQYSKIETERLFAHLVGKELSIRKQKGSYKGSYAPICHYFGYQGRSSLPCDFDAKLGKSYGALAGKIIEAGHTGYCASVRGLLNEAARWHMCGIPLLNMLDIKEHSSYGYGELVIQPSQLRLNSRSFTRLRSLREEWRLKDCYTNPGPIQFRGEMAGFLPELLALEFAEESEAFREIERQMTEIRTICKTVGDLGLLEIAKHSLGSLTESLRIIRNRLQQ